MHWGDGKPEYQFQGAMDQDKNIPLLFTYYFGASTSSTYRGASRRLKKWCRAFDQWLAERRRDYRIATFKQSVLAWKRLVRQCGKLPWDVTQADVEAHTAWMELEGYATGTVHDALGILASFYRWCDEHQVDPACGAGFNPAKAAARLRMKRYAGVELWSRDEVEAFLELLSHDESVLGKREYAFFLARLNLGVPLKTLQRLKWEQVELDEDGAWVRWRVGSGRVRLPELLWQALRDYLSASGRLEGMAAGKYIFAPLVSPVKEGTGGNASDWLEGRCLSHRQILSNIKLYGRRVGIAETKLTLMALRRTAIRLRMDTGESLPGMKVFMDSREEVRATKYRLGFLPPMPASGTGGSLPRCSELDLPDRSARPFKLGDNITHGFYSRRKDRQAVRAVVAENVQGVEQETACLRQLMRGLLECEGDDARLVEAYSQAANRLGDLISAAELAHKRVSDPWVEDVLRMMDEVERCAGRPPISQRVRQQALGLSSDVMDASGIVAEEIATIRLLLRNTYDRARQGVDSREYLRLVDLYGLGCVRLARLLRIGGSDEDGRLVRYIQDQMDEAIRQLHQEWRLGKPG